MSGTGFGNRFRRRCPDGCPLYSVGSLLRSRTAVQSRHRTGMQPPFGALLSGMRHRIGNRQGTGIGLRPLQALPRRRVRPGFRKRNDGPLPVDQAHGDGRRGTYERKPDRMGRGRSLLCGNGFQTLSERRSSYRKLAIHYRQM